MKTERTRAQQSPWFTINEAAEYLRISVSQVRKLARRGLLKATRVNPNSQGKMIFNQIWLDAFGMGYGSRIKEYQIWKKRNT